MRGAVALWCIWAPIALLFLCSCAHAKAPPITSEDWEVLHEYRHWIESAGSENGRCCDIADGRMVQVRVKDGRYQVQFLHPETLDVPRPSGWYDVPDKAIIRDSDGHPAPNPVGVPIAWWFQGYVRCFAMASLD